MVCDLAALATTNGSSGTIAKEDQALTSLPAVKPAAKPGVRPAAYATDAGDTSVPRAVRTHEKYERLVARAKSITAVPTAVVWPCEEHALAGPTDAAAENIIAPILVGSATRIRAAAQKAGLDIGRFAIVDVATEEEAAAAAVARAKRRASNGNGHAGRTETFAPVEAENEEDPNEWIE